MSLTFGIVVNDNGEMKYIGHDEVIRNDKIDEAEFLAFIESVLDMRTKRQAEIERHQEAMRAIRGG